MTILGVSAKRIFVLQYQLVKGTTILISNVWRGVLCHNIIVLCHFRSSLQWHMQLENWIKANAINLLCFIIITLATLAVTMLFCYHTYLMLTGQTTWEQVSRQRILYLKNLEMFTNPFDEGCCENVSTFLCGCRQIGRNWEIVYNKRIYRWYYILVYLLFSVFICEYL